MQMQTVRSTGKGWAAMRTAGFLAMLSAALPEGAREGMGGFWKGFLASLTGADIRTIGTIGAIGAVGAAIGLVAWASGRAGAWRDRA